MNKLVKRIRVFFGTFGSCVTGAWLDSDQHYHIPKTRFNGNSKRGCEEEPVRLREKSPAKNYFLGSFRDCLLTAWRASDEDYYIPKTRFMDADFNESAYRAPPGPGILRQVGNFFGTLKSCFTTAWEEAGHYHHLPKSSYQDPVFVKEKMESAPKPRRLLVHTLPFVEVGVVGGSAGDGWMVTTPEDQTEDLFFVPGKGGEEDSKPELEM